MQCGVLSWAFPHDSTFADDQAMVSAPSTQAVPPLASASPVDPQPPTSPVPTNIINTSVERELLLSAANTRIQVLESSLLLLRETCNKYENINQLPKRDDGYSGMKYEFGGPQWRSSQNWSGAKDRPRAAQKRTERNNKARVRDMMADVMTALQSTLKKAFQGNVSIRELSIILTVRPVAHDPESPRDIILHCQPGNRKPALHERLLQPASQPNVRLRFGSPGA